MLVTIADINKFV